MTPRPRPGPRMPSVRAPIAIWSSFRPVAARPSPTSVRCANGRTYIEQNSTATLGCLFADRQRTLCNCFNPRDPPIQGECSPIPTRPPRLSLAGPCPPSSVSLRPPSPLLPLSPLPPSPPRISPPSPPSSSLCLLRPTGLAVPSG